MQVCRCNRAPRKYETVERLQVLVDFVDPGLKTRHLQRDDSQARLIVILRWDAEIGSDIEEMCVS